MSTRRQNRDIPSPLLSPEEQGKKVRYLRILAGLSRTEVSKHNIEPGTLRHWEDGNYIRGLSKNALKKILAMCEAEGVSVSPEWILYGIGAGPIKYEQFEVPEKQSLDIEVRLARVTDDEEKTITRELAQFRKLNPDPIIFVVNDDGMAPQFMPGDYVAGTKCYYDEINCLIGYDCIIQTRNGQIFLRKLKDKNEKGYTLACINSQTRIKTPTLYNVEIVSAAYVVWHRRRNLPLKQNKS